MVTAANRLILPDVGSLDASLSLSRVRMAELPCVREAMEMASGNPADEEPARSWSQAAPPNERIVKTRTDERKRDSPNLDDIVDEWGWQSFPASDPPSNW